MQNLKIFCYKNDKNLVNFDPDTKISKKICSLIGPFCTKYITFDLKKYRGNMFHDTEESAKFEEKLTCGLENNMGNLANFHQNT